VSKIIKDNPWSHTNSDLPLIISLEQNQTGIIFLYANLKVLYYNWVTFHQYQFIRLGEHSFTRHLDKWKDRRTGWSLFNL